MVGKGSKVGRKFISQRSFPGNHLRSSIYLVLAFTGQLHANHYGNIGEQENYGERERERERKRRLYRNIYVLNKIIEEEHILEVKSTQYVPNWHVGWFPSGP